MKTRCDVVGALVPDRDGVRVSADERGLIVVTGPDAVEFLHRICSQDIEGLAVGAIAPAAFLNPKGKLVATASIGRCEDGLRIETASGNRAGLAEYLDRFHFTEALTIDAGADLVCRTVLGRDVWSRCGVANAGVSVESANGGSVCQLADAVGDVQIVRWHGPADAVAERGSFAPEASEVNARLLRMLVGHIEVGRDADESTIALEAPIESAISTTKGCYTGQEIVARIHTYGHVNRHLVLLDVAAGGLEAETPLFELEDGEACGRLTTVAPLAADAGASLAFGYVPRDLAAPGTELAVGTADGPRAVVIEY